MHFTPDHQQLLAIDSEHSKILVLAGAGSGKTATTIARIKRLIDSGTSPLAIVAITFTNKAANEMETRLGQSIGFCGTIHSFVLQLVQSHRHVLGYQSQVTVIDETEQDRILKDISRVHKYSGTKKEVKDLIDLGIPVLPPRPTKPMLVCKDYYDTLIRSNIIDMDSILVLGAELFTRFPQISIICSGQAVSHFFVDELQDCSDIDAHIFAQLPIENRFFVGDGDQCQPVGTMIRMSDGTLKAIELISQGDSVVTYGRHEKVILRSGIVNMISKRLYNGHMFSISANGSTSRCTPNHRWLIKWLSGIDRDVNLWCVYMMRQGDRFRIGKTRLFRNSGRCPYNGYVLGCALRMKQEKADSVWILSVHKSNLDAIVKEDIISATYGIPQTCFQSGNFGYTKEAIDTVYSSLPMLLPNAVRCLQDHHRELMYPLISKTEKKTRRTVQEVHACNLMDDIMSIPVCKQPYDWKTRDGTWYPITVTVNDYRGDVFSLNVDKYHKYVSDGLVTCNSIYGFRGGNIQHILAIARDPKWLILKLEKNYRSSPQICEVAQNLIEHNTNRVPKVLMPARGKSGAVAIIQFPSAGAERNTILARINGYLAGGIPESEIAVLIRFNPIVDVYAQFLKDAGLPVGTVRDAIMPDDWRKCLLLISLLGNPNNDYLAGQFLMEHIGPEIAKKVIDGAMTNYVSINDFILHFRTNPDLKYVLEMLSHYGISQDCISMVKACASKLFMERAKEADCNSIVLAMKRENEVVKVGSGITVSTIHAAKGLEFGIVFMPAFEQEVLPGTGKKVDIEEMRRLAYVGMTRAKDELIITHCDCRPPMFGYGNDEPATPSQFIQEIGL